MNYINQGTEHEERNMRTPAASPTTQQLQQQVSVISWKAVTSQESCSPSHDLAPNPRTTILLPSSVHRKWSLVPVQTILLEGCSNEWPCTRFGLNTKKIIVLKMTNPQTARSN